MKKHGHLPRLAPGFYQGHAMVHWTLTIENRKTGWLNHEFHSNLRDVLFRIAEDYSLLVPTYCLMPDHIHMLWVGLTEQSHQRNAMKSFKRYANPLLAPVRFQREPYDHVLREEDRQRGAFQSIAYYILENPVRADLTQTSVAWPFSGMIVPGWPELSPHLPADWDQFWLTYRERRVG